MNNGKRLNIEILLFALPGLLMFIVFFYVPVISSFYFSLFDWQGFTSIAAAEFIGFGNYAEIFTDTVVLNSIGNTVLYTVIVTFLQNALGLAAALAVNLPFRSRNVTRTLLFMPCLLSSVVVGFTWSKIYDPNMGILNQALGKLGLDALQMSWLGNGAIALYSVMAVAVWQWLGYFMVIYLAGLQSIPREVYEAATIDGASAVQAFRSVTFPLLAPAVTTGVVLATVWNLKVFDIIFILTKGGPGYATEVVSSQIYTLGFITDRSGYSTALSVLLFIAIFLLGLIQLKILRKREDIY